MPTFHRPQQQAKSLRVPLHLPLNTYHRSSPFQPADTHVSLYVSGEHLVFKARDRVLEPFVLALKSTVAVDFHYQRPVAELTECFIHVVVPHVVSVKKPKYVGCNGGRGNVYIMDGSCVDLAVVGRAL
jgi:hypothetical protein